MTLKAIVQEAEEGGFWAVVPASPGCFTQGESIQELRNLQCPRAGTHLATGIGGP